MKFKMFLIVLIASLITGCSGEEKVDTKTKNIAAQEEVNDEENSKDEENKIDTSVFQYAEKVEVTDAIEINEHVTIFVFMNEEVKPGLATQHVLNQSYDFLKQSDITGAKTVSIAIKQGDMKIAQFTVNKDDFTPNDSESMVSVVLSAGEMEFMIDEVKEYGKVMNLW